VGTRSGWKEKTNTLDPIAEEEHEFREKHLGFTTDCRPDSYRRTISEASTPDIDVWFTSWTRTVGETAVEHKDAIKRMLYTWRDFSVDDVRDMRSTDLLEHRIPTYSHSKPRTANPQLYTQEEEAFQ
jgi:hypothetical protein